MASRQPSDGAPRPSSTQVYDVLAPSALDPQQFGGPGSQGARSVRRLWQRVALGEQRQVQCRFRVPFAVAAAAALLLAGAACKAALGPLKPLERQSSSASRGSELELVDLGGKPCALGKSLRHGDGPCVGAEAHSAAAPSGSAVATWQVVRPGFTNVRSSKLFQRVIGMKAPCMMVRGRQEGPWVRLEGEPGYIVISHNGETILERSPVRYTGVSSGTCADHGQHPIADLQSCTAAAAAMGLPNITAQLVASSGRPEGCYSFAGRPWLATNPSNKGSGALGQRKPLCSDQAEPHAEPCRGKAHALLGQRSPETSAGAAGPTTTVAAPSVPAGLASAGPSLFCFTVASMAEAELKLLQAQVRKPAGIFRCSEYMVLTNGGATELGQHVQTTLIPPLRHGQPAQLDLAALVAAWAHVIGAGSFRKHDWTVKVDVSAVFIPERLQRRLRGMTSTEGVFFSDCDRFAGSPRLLGAVEVLSRGAVEAYAAGKGRCHRLLRTNQSEGAHLQSCLRELKVGEIFDGHMVADGRCWSSPCTDASKMAFYPHGEVDRYMSCLETAYEASSADQ